MGFFVCGIIGRFRLEIQINKYFNILSLCGFLVLSGCSSTVPSSIPDWFSNKEILQKQAPDKYFGYGSGTSANKLMAREKALSEATLDLKTNSNNIIFVFSKI